MRTGFSVLKAGSLTDHKGQPPVIKILGEKSFRKELSGKKWLNFVNIFYSLWFRKKPGLKFLAAI